MFNAYVFWKLHIWCHQQTLKIEKDEEKKTEAQNKTNIISPHPKKKEAEICHQCIISPHDIDRHNFF